MKGFVLGLFAILFSGYLDFTYVKAAEVKFVVGDTSIKDGMNLMILRDDITILNGYVGIGLDLTCTECDFTYSIKEVGQGHFQVKWSSNNKKLQFKDCFSLNGESSNWYGGPQMYTQRWPIEKLRLNGTNPYVLRKEDNFAIAERYWLNSNGTFIFIEDAAPLYVDSNIDSPGKVCFIARADGPYFNRSSVTLNYDILVRDNPKEAHLFAVNNYLGKPSGMPNTKMISDPIFTTYTRFYKTIYQDQLLYYGSALVSHGFTKGQIEVDQQWEDCYGTHIFDPSKYYNVPQMVEEVKKNFTITLWISPFVNVECGKPLNIGERNGYFVQNSSGNMNAIWWEANYPWEDDVARQIDFTNPEAAKWFSDSVTDLKDTYSFDGFKFEGGETNFVAQPSVYPNVDQNLIPNIFTQKYLEVVVPFGDMTKIRSGFRTQHYPVFLRMMDKDSVWGVDAGLQSVVTTLLQLNMNGYTLVMPDVIGGKGYRRTPDGEILVRWAQATVFMPAMQFGLLPWEYDTDKINVTEIVRNMVKLHENYSGEIIKAMEASITNGTPVNPPIWWIDPLDPTALASYDEFLLGENILVAPVMVNGDRSRSIYLPKGTWKDGNNGTIYNGPVTLDYDAPIELLPYFLKQ